MMTEHISRKILTLLSLALLTCSYAYAQATFESASNKLSFRAGKFTISSIKSVHIFDSKTGKSTEIPLSRLVPGPFGGEILSIVLNPGEAPAALSTYPANLTIVIQPDPNEDKMTIRSLEIHEVGTRAASGFKNTSADGRDDANVYISGQAIVEHGQGPQFALDIKLQREVAIENVPLRVAPFVEIKASNDDGGTDKSNGGVRFISTANRLRYEGSAEIETDHKFRVANFITAHEVKYLFPTLRQPKKGTPKTVLFPRVFIGGEFGRNLKSPVPRDERGIARLKAGATLTLKVFEPIKDFSYLGLGLQDLVWENRFEQRWFLLKEQAYDSEDDVLVLRDFGRRPRGHFSSNLHFMFNDFFGPTVSYEWGELPPLYKKVDHRVTFGLTFALKRDPDSQ